MSTSNSKCSATLPGIGLAGDGWLAATATCLGVNEGAFGDGTMRPVLNRCCLCRLTDEGTHGDGFRASVAAWFLFLFTDEGTHGDGSRASVAPWFLCLFTDEGTHGDGSRVSTGPWFLCLVTENGNHGDEARANELVAVAEGVHDAARPTEEHAPPGRSVCSTAGCDAAAARGYGASFCFPHGGPSPGKPRVLSKFHDRVANVDNVPSRSSEEFSLGQNVASTFNGDAPGMKET